MSFHGSENIPPLLSSPTNHRFWHCKTPEEPDWLELLMGLQACTYVCLQRGGLQNRWMDRGLPTCTAPHSRYFPSRQVVLGLTSTVPTTLHVYFNISNYVTHQERGDIFLLEEHMGSGLTWGAPELQHKIRNSLLCPQRLCCAYHSCSQLSHDNACPPWQRLGLSSGKRAKNTLRPATTKGLQLRL